MVPASVDITSASNIEHYTVVTKKPNLIGRGYIPGKDALGIGAAEGVLGFRSVAELKTTKYMGVLVEDDQLQIMFCNSVAIVGRLVCACPSASSSSAMRRGYAKWT